MRWEDREIEERCWPTFELVDRCEVKGPSVDPLGAGAGENEDEGYKVKTYVH